MLESQNSRPCKIYKNAFANIISDPTGRGCLFEGVLLSEKSMVSFLLYSNTWYCFNVTIGITHVFSCISICRVPRMLFEHAVSRLNVQTSSEGPGKCLCNETNMCDRYSCIPYSNPFRTENAAKTLNRPFFYTGFLETKWRRLCTFECHI